MKNIEPAQFVRCLLITTLWYCCLCYCITVSGVINSVLDNAQFIVITYDLLTRIFKIASLVLVFCPIPFFSKPVSELGTQRYPEWYASSPLFYSFMIHFNITLQSPLRISSVSSYNFLQLNFVFTIPVAWYPLPTPSFNRTNNRSLRRTLQTVKLMITIHKHGCWQEMDCLGRKAWWSVNRENIIKLYHIWRWLIHALNMKHRAYVWVCVSVTLYTPDVACSSHGHTLL